MISTQRKSAGIGEILIEKIVSRDKELLVASQALLDAGHYSDVTIRCGNEIVRAHKVILHGLSGYFHDILKHGLSLLSTC